MKQNEFFTSRWGLILATLGIAVGTGNIWRFSRIVAQNGGGSFLIPWVIFLFVWSLPLIIAEFAIGKFARLGPMGAIAKIAGKKFIWMGGFIAFVSTAIMFYYSVVTGWTIRYFIASVSGDLFSTTDHLAYWNTFSSGLQPVYYHLAAMLVGTIVVFRGIVKGIEKTNKFLVSTLVIILLIILVRSVMLPNAIEGLKYFFTPQLKYLLDYKVWLNALTQNAWDTGAGWGLILTYAVYMKKSEDVPLNAALIGFGNNSISLIAGIIIFSTVFSFSSVDAMNQITQSGPANTGLTFIYLPMLFSHLSSNVTVNLIFASMFFLALAFAAISSLISLIELTTKTFIDFGFDRKKAVVIVGLLGFLLGIPSAINIDIFTNQDWVWGVGLIISGAFMAFAIMKFGVDKFRTDLINGDSSDIHVGKWYSFIIKYLIPVQAVVLLGWWLISSVSWDVEWWNPFHTENAGTCLFQWGIVLIVLIVLSNRFKKLLFERND
ncbi:MAG: sodium-dependent transporter [Chlorobi bacterium]|nr:sodium-dependent transporter [Chlorobiota bacterium]